MKTITLSESGPDVSQIIYSYWRAAEDAALLNAQEVEKRLHTCTDLGITTFDHADVYGNYQVEAWFGNALKRSQLRREDIIISTKCGISLPDVSRPQNRVRHYDNSPAHIRRSVENSLRNLQTDYIDVFLLHHFDPLSDPDETASVLTELVLKGYVKHIGVANFTVHQHKLLQDRLSLPIVTNHFEFNVLHTKPLEDGTIDFIRQQYSKPMAWAPLAGGRLQVYNDERTYNVTSTLRRIAEQYGINVEQLAIAWLLETGALPIVGTNSYQRILNATSATDIKLDKQDWYEIYFAATVKSHAVSLSV